MPTIKETLSDKAAYGLAKPRFLGTLHERMKLVMHEMGKHRMKDFVSHHDFEQLCQLLHDLEIEVSMTHDDGVRRGAMD